MLDHVDNYICVADVFPNISVECICSTLKFIEYTNINLFAPPTLYPNTTFTNVHGCDSGSILIDDAMDIDNF